MFSGQKIPFIKMQGLSNYFIIVYEHDLPNSWDTSDIIKIADRHMGIGCDQFILLSESKTADIFTRIYNDDGSEVQACGNATRCIAKLLNKDECVIETVAGLLKATMNNGMISVNMGQPKTDWQDIPLSKNYAWNDLPLFNDGLPKGRVVNVGNPHIVFIVDDVTQIDLKKIGSFVENHSLFPEKTNVEFVQIIDNKNVRMRVWERGVGVTMACGSGACAVGHALFKDKIVSENTVNVHLDGGVLKISKKEDSIIMTGEASFVCEGSYFYEPQEKTA